jgi:hypothetical protein
VRHVTGLCAFIVLHVGEKAPHKTLLPQLKWQTLHMAHTNMLSHTQTHTCTHKHTQEHVWLARMYVYTVYDRIIGDFPAKKILCTYTLYIYTWSWPPLCTHTQTTHMYTYTHMHTCTHTNAHIHTYTHMHTCTHTHTHTHTYTHYTHTHHKHNTEHTHTHAHTHCCDCSQVRPFAVLEA